MQKLKEEVKQTIAPLVPLEEEEVLSILETPPDPSYGDLAFPCFTLARELKKPPPAIATELSEKLAGQKGYLWEKWFLPDRT